jgi:hypothetical protein
MWTKPSKETEEISVDFNENDLNDPHLLAELAKLTIDTRDAIEHQIPEIEQEVVVDVDALTADLPLEDPADVELTEQDMQDPVLLV